RALAELAGCYFRQGGPRNLPDVLPKINHDGRHGAPLNHRGEGCPRVVPIQEGRYDSEMGCAADGQEFGEALNNAQNDGIQEGHESLGVVNKCESVLAWAIVLLLTKKWCKGKMGPIAYSSSSKLSGTASASASDATSLPVKSLSWSRS